MFKCLHRRQLWNTTLFYVARLLYAPYLGVTHKTLLETDSQSVGFKLYEIMFVPDSIHMLSLSVEDSISLFVVRQSPSIVDAEVISLRYEHDLDAGSFTTHIKQTFSRGFVLVLTRRNTGARLTAIGLLLLCLSS